MERNRRLDIGKGFLVSIALPDHDTRDAEGISDIAIRVLLHNDLDLLHSVTPNRCFRARYERLRSTRPGRGEPVPLPRLSHGRQRLNTPCRRFQSAPNAYLDCGDVMACLLFVLMPHYNRFAVVPKRLSITS